MKKISRLIMTETQKYALIGALFGLAFPIVATIVRISNSDLPFQLTSVVYVQSTDSLLWIIDTAPLFLGFFAAFAGRRQDNLQQVNDKLRQREIELENAKQNLELRVEERTHELIVANQQTSKRAEQLKLVADVAKSAISIQDVDRLLPNIAELIHQRFNIYHVGVFLLDEQRQYAILQASNSAGGLIMLKRAHRLKVGAQGIVGFVTSRGEPRIALDVGQDAAFFDNPDLPGTRSELALPLKIGEMIIGALDLQSTEEKAFSVADISVLSILSDQVAIAIQNARSSEQAQRALYETEVAAKQLSGEAWKGYAKTLQTRGYRYDGVKSEALKEASNSKNQKDALSIPVQLRGYTIGHLKLKAIDATHKWTEDERAIIESTAERVALAMDGARLLEEAQKRATRESFLSDIGAKLGESFQLDSILRDTVEELGQTLAGSTVSFQLVNPSAPPQAEKPNEALAQRKKSE
jgi:GAF domain-containing protein